LQSSELTLGVRFRIVALEENKYYAPFEKPVSKLVNWVTQPSRSKTEAECNSKGLTPLWIELWVERLPISRPNVSKIENNARVIAD